MWPKAVARKNTIQKKDHVFLCVLRLVVFDDKYTIATVWVDQKIDRKLNPVMPSLILALKNIGQSHSVSQGEVGIISQIMNDLVSQTVEFSERVNGLQLFNDLTHGLVWTLRYFNG